jgi:hypothetical protein
LQVPALQGLARGVGQSSQPHIGGGQSTAAVGRLPALRRVATQDLAPAAGAGVRSGSDKGAPASAFREPGLQQRLGELQQGLAYAQRLGQDLQGLKNGLSRALVQGKTPAMLQPQLDAVQQTWQARAGDSGGQLDARLQAVAEGEDARQRFRLRGLDMQALAAPGAETLRLSLPGQPRSIAVPLDGQGLQRSLHSLRQALAPTGLRVETSGGELQFSITESQWPALRDGMSLRGDGKRFPSGQMLRVLLDPQADAMTPGDWQIDSPQAQRRSLAQVVAAQQQLGNAQQALSQQLASASAVPAFAEDAQQMAAFAARFASDASTELLDYGRLSELAPALQGLHRQQVQQLLLSGPALLSA